MDKYHNNMNLASLRSWYQSLISQILNFPAINNTSQSDVCVKSLSVWHVLGVRFKWNWLNLFDVRYYLVLPIPNHNPWKVWRRKISGVHLSNFPYELSNAICFTGMFIARSSYTKIATQTFLSYSSSQPAIYSAWMRTRTIVFCFFQYTKHWRGCSIEEILPEVTCGE